jgi:hypothetical protein
MIIMQSHLSRCCHLQKTVAHHSVALACKAFCSFAFSSGWLILIQYSNDQSDHHFGEAFVEVQNYLQIKLKKCVPALHK